MSHAKPFERNNSKPYQDNNNAPLNGESDIEPSFNGAAIIDEQGNEVPITEDMIQAACKKLGNAWLFPRQGSQH